MKTKNNITNKERLFIMLELCLVIPLLILVALTYNKKNIKKF